jgi:uncharacterized protein (DUF983 family)
MDERDLGKWSNRIPNREFVVYVAALIVAGIVVWIADTLTVDSWLVFFEWTTVAYLLSRGIAKAHNVKE